MYGNEIIKNTSVRSNSPGHNTTFRLFHISTASSHLYKASFIHHITPHIPQFHHIFLQAILSYYRCCHHDERTITILHFTFPSYGHWLFKFNLILSRYLFMFTTLLSLDWVQGENKLHTMKTKHYRSSLDDCPLFLSNDTFAIFKVLTFHFILQSIWLAFKFISSSLC